MAFVLRPEPDPTLPAWPSDTAWGSGLSAARGICWSMLVGALLWLSVAVAAWALFG